MKKKMTVILLILALLVSCGTQAPVAPPTVEVPDIETIIQQSVNEAIQEKAKEYEEEQKKKDQEIAELKVWLENLAAQSETPPEGPMEKPSAPSAGAVPTTDEPPSQAETSPQPESAPQPKPEPEETMHAKSSAPPASYDGFDLPSYGRTLQERLRRFTTPQAVFWRKHKRPFAWPTRSEKTMALILCPSTMTLWSWQKSERRKYGSCTVIPARTGHRWWIFGAERTLVKDTQQRSR